MSAHLRAAWGRRIAAASDRIARGLVLDEYDESFAKKVVDGTVTAQEFARVLGSDGLGVWWGVMGEYGDLEDFEDHAYGSGDEYLTLKGMIEEGRVGDDYIAGEIRVVLIAKRPTRNGEPWDPEVHNDPSTVGMGNSYLEEGEPIDLIEIRYDAGWGWKSLPAQGIRSMASASRYFHGTGASLSVGDVLDANHGSNSYAVQNGSGVFVTDDVALAFFYAVLGPLQSGNFADPHVYEVEPVNPRPNAAGEFVCDSATIVRDVTTRGKVMFKTQWEQTWKPGVMEMATDPATQRIMLHEFERRIAKTAGAQERMHGEVKLTFIPDFAYGTGKAIQATVGGREVGYLTWGKDDRTIHDVGVHPPYQRKGIASAMLAFAREIEPGLQHSHALTPDGRAWSQAVGMRSLA